MTIRKIAVLGSGGVGEVLSNAFIKLGYEVMRSSRAPEKLKEWKVAAGKRASIGTFDQGAKFGDIIILAVKGSAAESAIQLCSTENMNGKTIIDATNPIADKPPANGVLFFFTEMNYSLMERLQKLRPQAKFVKAFSSVGKDFMFRPKFGTTKPTMFICGNNEQSKKDVSEILSEFGWEAEDMGAVEAARAIEPLCMLWCIPGIKDGQWTHAFKLLKKQPKSKTKKKSQKKSKKR